ncbi:MAG: hypothetical protein JWR21_1810 [Herminiimonas sp.]|nr:hypothetical protein [Herminiimonas sp.]
MTSRFWLNVAALSAVATVIAVAAIAIPAERANAAIALAVLLFAAAVGLLFFLPRSRQGRNEAATLGSLGPVGAICSAQLIWSGISVLVALNGHVAASYAMDAVAVGGFIVAWSLLNIVARLIGHASASSETVSDHGVWHRRISGLAHICTENSMRLSVMDLADSIRYVARDRAGSASVTNTGIAQSIDALESAIRQNDASSVSLGIKELQLALAEREQRLKSERTKI